MSEDKKIVVSLPQNLLDEFDEVIKLKSKKNRSQFIREAVILYINENRKANKVELMKKGYLEMSKLNCEISEMGISCDCEELAKYEAGLSESDFLNGTGGEKGRYFLCRSQSSCRF